MKYLIIAGVVLVLLLGITFFAPSVLPQRSYGTISGAIMDRDGRVLGSGNITVKGWPSTLYVFMGLSDLAAYRIEVPPGFYSVSAASSDFQYQTVVISVLPHQNVRLDFKPEPAKH